MDTERDVTRIVQSWLRTDEHESADRVLDNVLALLDTTPQRRSWWPALGSANVNTFAKLLLAAAAVVVVAIFAIPRGGGVVSPGPSPSPSPTPSASPAPIPSPTTRGIAALDGTGGTRVGQVDGIQVTLTFPPGWVTGIVGQTGGFVVDKAVSTGEASIFVWNPDNVYSDPCARTKLSPAVGRSAAAFAAAVSKISGIGLVTPPSDVTVNGRPGKLVVLTVPEKAACQAGQSGFHLWYNQDSGDDCTGDVECGRFATALGDTIRLWIVDVGGERVIFEAETPKGSSPDLDAEVQRIVDSITFD